MKVSFRAARIVKLACPEATACDRPVTLHDRQSTGNGGNFPPRYIPHFHSHKHEPEGLRNQGRVEKWSNVFQDEGQW
jgi:hypothetical protein